MLDVAGMTITRGARYRTRKLRAATLYSVGYETRTMMHACASAARLRGGRPILHHGVKAKVSAGSRPPRIVVGDPAAFAQIEPESLSGTD
jgi:hypothetical protein